MSQEMMMQDQRQRGSVTLEMVIVFPLLLMLLFGMAQAGLWFHHRNIAIAAALEGARAAVNRYGSTDDGRSVASSFAARSGLKNASVSVSRSGDMVSVRVTAPAPALVPGIPLPGISQAASLPLERIR